MSTETESIVTAEAGSRSVRQAMRQVRRTENRKVPTSAGRKAAGRRETAAGYGFLVPWLIGFLGLTVGPMIFSLYLAFTKYNLFTEPEWVGLDNFVRMFTEDPNYIQSVQITLVYVLVGTPIKLAAALGVAMLLNYRDRGSGFFRSSFYAPSLIGASVSVAIVWRAMFSNDGPVDNSLSFFGIDIGGWVGNVQLVIPMMILLAVWQFGAPMVIFLAGLKQIPQELYEAAEVDGAGPWHRFRNVTIPVTRNVRIEQDLIDQLFSSSEKRLARALLLLARYGKQTKPRQVVATISQETLSEMIGTTRSRVNFFMNKFKKLGFIEYRRQPR